MKVLTPRWLALAMVVATFFYWQWGQSSIGPKVVETKTTNSTRKAPAASGPSLIGLGAVRAEPKSALSQVEMRALIHLKLHQWLEVQANGGDDNDHSLEELEALLAQGDVVD